MDLLETGIEYRHPWELSRNGCIIKTILPYLNETRRTAADIGCGDLFFTETFAAFFDGEIYAVDTGFTGDASGENLNEHTTDKHPSITKLHNISRLADNSIDIAILMDVLEHIENQKEFLTQLSAKLSKEAIIFITVPAYQHLFSEHDTFLKHYRRYNKKSLSAVLTGSGFRVERIFYFYSMLYILRLVQFITTRLIKSNRMAGNISQWNKSETSKSTKIIKSLLNLDFRFNRQLGRLSLFGLSLFAICRVNV